MYSVGIIVEVLRNSLFARKWCVLNFSSGAVAAKNRMMAEVFPCMHRGHQLGRNEL